MRIRKASLKDLNLILKFMKTKNKSFVRAYIKNKHNFFFICLDNNKIVGMIDGELWDDKGFAYIGSIEANQKKIIDSMFGYFLKFCKKKKIGLINTYVRKDKLKQIKIFKSLGMRKKGEHFYFEKRLK